MLAAIIVIIIIIRGRQQPSSESVMEAELEPRGSFIIRYFLDYRKLPLLL